MVMNSILNYYIIKKKALCLFINALDHRNQSYAFRDLFNGCISKLKTFTFAAVFDSPIIL